MDNLERFLTRRRAKKMRAELSIAPLVTQHGKETWGQSDGGTRDDIVESNYLIHGQPQPPSFPVEAENWQDKPRAGGK